MRLWFRKLLMIALVLLVFSCSKAEDREQYNGVGETTLVSETAAGDYIIRLVSDKGIYMNGEPMMITAKMKYVGEEEGVEILYERSPFSVDILEVSSGKEIPYYGESDRGNYLLERDEWYEETFELVSEWEAKVGLDESLPFGEYEVELRTDFYTIGDDGEEYQHNYTTSILLQSLAE